MCYYFNSFLQLSSNNKYQGAKNEKDFQFSQVPHFLHSWRHFRRRHEHLFIIPLVYVRRVVQNQRGHAL